MEIKARLLLLTLLGLISGIVSIPVDGPPGAALGIAAIVLGFVVFRKLTAGRRS